jgi:peptidyl-prolyl cis-trans isomerase C
MKLTRLYVMFGLACVLRPDMCLAQREATTPSPAAPLDLSKPQFDTVTPVYGMPALSKTAAATVVAEVEGRAITLGQVGDTIRTLPRASRSLPFETVYEMALLQLTEIQALVIRAQRRGLDEQPAVQGRAKLAYDNAVAEAELTAEANASVTEVMVLDRYQKDYGEKADLDEVDVSIIVVETEKEADAILAELAGGAPFEAVARRASRDSSASAGGHLGFVRRNTLTPEVAAVAFTLAPGQTTARPLKTDADWFIVRAGQHRQGERPPFAAVQAQIRQDLMREAFPALGKAALEGLIVRTFAITGKDSTVAPALQP